MEPPIKTSPLVRKRQQPHDSMTKNSSCFNQPLKQYKFGVIEKNTVDAGKSDCSKGIENELENIQKSI